MKDKIESGELPEIRRIVESINLHKKGEPGDYSPILEWEITEVLKKKLKFTARHVDADAAPVQANLLASCIEQVKALLTGQLQDSEDDFDLNPYFEQAKESLQPAARQISESLGSRSRLKALGIDIPPPELRRLDSGVVVLVTYVGHMDSVDGLFLTPQTELFELDLESIPQQYAIGGEYTPTDFAYPVEIHGNGMCFVLDDDGTIFVSTKDSVGAETEDVLERLIHLATRIFVL